MRFTECVENTDFVEITDFVQINKSLLDIFYSLANTHPGVKSNSKFDSSKNPQTDPRFSKTTSATVVRTLYGSGVYHD